MEPIDRIVFGDNQFFGINHMSQERAQQQAERFRDLESIIDVYRHAFDAGIRAVMLNSNDRARAICDHFRAHAADYPELTWYPSIPYPHKYANLVAEKGIIMALKEVMLSDNNASGVLGLVSKGGMALFGKNEIKAMQMLIDIEMRAFRDLNVRVIFLQNVITDLILGLGLPSVFEEYCDYIKTQYGVIPGLITQNLPRLVGFLASAGISGVAICSSFNKIGYLMSPNVDAYVSAAAANDPAQYQIMAMSTLASGAIPPREAYYFINQQNVQSVVFGASTAKHIFETVDMIAPAPAVS